jgi:hypothetical protein
MTSIRATRWVPALAALALALTPAAASADRAEWNQEEVTKIAVQLRDSTQDLRNTFRKGMNPNPGGLGMRQAQDQLLEDLRRITNETRKLALQLEAGKGRDDTYPSWQRLNMWVRDAREEGRRQMIKQDALDQITVARDALNQLGPYYEKDFKPATPAVR